MAGRSQISSAADHSPPEAANRTYRHRRGILRLVVLLALAALAVNAPGLLARFEKRRLRALTMPALESLVQKEPANIEGRYHLGLAYARADRQPEAVREFVAVLEKDPIRADVLNDLGVSYLLQQRYHECLVALRGALTAQPDFAPARANLGRLYIATHMPFSAVKELERAVKLEPNNPSTRCDLGEAYQRTLNQASAEQAYRDALKVDANHTPARVGLGKILYARTRYDESERELTQALVDDPNNADALTTLGRMRLERSIGESDLAQVRGLFERAAKADPQSPDVWYDLGRATMREKRPAQAVEMFRRALRISSSHTAAMNQLERALRAAGQIQEADRVARAFHQLAMRSREKNRLEERISRNPGDWDSRARLVEIYLQSGDTGLAQLVYRQIKEGAPTHPKLPNLSRVFARFGSAPESAP